MAYDVERGIAHLVSMVIATASAAGCGSAEPGPRTGGEDIATSAPMGGATVTATPTSSATVAARTPTELCNVYRDAVTVDPNGPKGRSPTETTTSSNPHPADVTAYAAANDLVVCEIVWERTSSQTGVMIAPVCCPQARMQRPCPPATLQMMPTEHTKLEKVVLSSDGKIVSSELRWNDFVQEPMRHHCGRRPEGFADEARGSDAAGCLAEMAALESASIGAFDRLARELGALGAPADLIARARAARRDEIRHARVVGALARRRGAALRPVRSRRLPVRCAVDVAIENAVEGCVFEAFGAAIATFQAARAQDADVRSAFERIAMDERAHAALAWDVDAFLATVLDATERDAVERARGEARERLRASSPMERAPTRLALGLPTPREHRALADSISCLA